MKKEKVYIVISHKHSLKKGSKNDWEVSEVVEFVNQLRTKHYTTSSAIADYINRKMITGSRIGMHDYNKFEQYIGTKYAKELEQLDSAYKVAQVPDNTPAPSTEFEDEFGNIRERNVFDKAPA